MPDYQDEFDIDDKAGNKIFIEVELHDIKFDFTKGENPYGSPPDHDEWEILSYDSKVFITYGDNDRLEIKDETNKKGLLMSFAPEDKVLEEMVPKWKNNRC